MDEPTSEMRAARSTARPRPIEWLRNHAVAADMILAVLITTMSVVFHLLDFELDDEDFVDPAWWTVLLVVASVFPVAWRRSRPIPVALFVVAAQIIAAVADVDGTGFLGVVVALYSLGAHASGVRRTRVLVAIGAALGLLFVAARIVDELDVGSLISTVVVLITAFVLGDNLRRRRDAAHALEERVERAERERELIDRQHITDERTRIARELHDIVAHSVSVMVIQAGAARRNLATSPEIAEEALTNIETTGRRTMDELRGVLGVLRRNEAEVGQTDRADVPDLAPQPSLLSVGVLVAAAEDLPVSLDTVGDLDGLASSTDLTAYRIIQESLTNVRRHAGPVTRVGIRIERTDAAVTIAVDDDGRGSAADVGGPGYGLVGMRERVAAVGGSVDAGPRSGGGWRVSAALPTESIRAGVS